MKNCASLDDVRKIPIMAALLLAGFSSLLSETLLNVALPEFMKDFGISANKAGWLVTGYLLVIGVCVPAAAYFMQKFRTRILFFAAAAFFLLGSVICPLADSFYVLLGGRLIQAVGTAILIPLNLNVLLVLNPPEKRGAANGFFILVIMFAPAVGPTISGFILEHWSWRALFWSTLPLMAAAAVLGVIFMRDVTKNSRPKFDLLSMTLSTLGFGLFIYGMSLIGHMDIWTVFCIVLGALALIVFVIRQLKLEKPMLDLRVFKFRPFALGSAFIAIAMVSLFSNLMMAPIFLQKVLALSALATGLVMMPSGLLNGFMAPVTGKIYDKFGGRYLLPLGCLIIFSALLLLSGVDENTRIPEVVGYLCLLSVGVPFVMTSAQTGGLNGLPPAYYPHGAAVMNTVQQISAAFGSSFFITVMTSAQKWYMEQYPAAADLNVRSLAFGVDWAYKGGALSVCLALLLSILIFIKKW